MCGYKKYIYTRQHPSGKFYKQTCIKKISCPKCRNKYINNIPKDIQDAILMHYDDIQKPYTIAKRINKDFTDANMTYYKVKQVLKNKDQEDKIVEVEKIEEVETTFEESENEGEESEES